MSDNSLRYIEIKRRLARHISDLGPHERLPSRTDLSKTYQVARTTIERAVSELIGEGLLYAKDGSGTYVSESTTERRTLGRDNRGIANWGLLVPDILHYIYPGIVRGVSDVASDHDVNLMICNTDNRFEKQTKHLHKLIDSEVQGVIIVPAINGIVDHEPFYRLQEAGIPFVFCHRSLDGIQAPRVISNNFHAGYLATKHLIRSGYTRIGYISRPPYSASADRFQGYSCALSEAGLAARSRWIAFESSFESDGEGYFSARRMLTEEERPDAIFCFNDGIAKGAYAAAAELGLRIGADVGIVSCDNTNICETLRPKLTSIAFPTYQAGKLAARILIEGGANAGGQPVVLQPELIRRDSVAVFDRSEAAGLLDGTDLTST
ncbi:GntR family transcriptional regulator [Paenibacillus sp.]|uniref:GntR family transcriptional regulator n=1 Tax=Paenibacillus sp. TaxID=58172 RepID=UPI002810C7A6|nr:GntR family transcriptional regulator [Paenibacillus sp.]